MVVKREKERGGEEREREKRERKEIKKNCGFH